MVPAAAHGKREAQKDDPVSLKKAAGCATQSEFGEQPGMRLPITNRHTSRRVVPPAQDRAFIDVASQAAIIPPVVSLTFTYTIGQEAAFL